MSLYFRLPIPMRTFLDRTFCGGLAIGNGVIGIHAVLFTGRDIELVSNVLY